MQGRLKPVAARSSFAWASLAGILAAEWLTGIGITLLGSMLPAVASAWHLDDARSGSMLLAVFAGASAGALLTRPPFHRAVAAGLALVAICMAALAISGGQLLFLLLLLFGIGLGLVMTSNSLLIGERYPERRAAMLTLLNFSWSVGAAVSPFAVNFILGRTGVLGVCWGMAVAAALGALLALSLVHGDDRSPVPAPLPTPAPAPRHGRVVVFFALFGMLYCGAEASLGGWVLTYVHRLGFHASAAPPLAASCFWLSLLAGRAIAPAVLLRVREDRLLAVSLVCAFASVVALLTLRSLPGVLLAAALAGFSLAPVFPIFVSIFLALAADAGEARWLFAVAGVGSAGFPWITGQVAARTGSLHMGLMVPLAALVVMLAMLRWPGGGTELFRKMFPSRGRPSVLSST